jgi:hypothetical protein
LIVDSSYRLSEKQLKKKMKSRNVQKIFDYNWKRDCDVDDQIRSKK